MAGPHEDRVFDHDFDGIQEYDNPMPSWWLAIFGISILWAALYFAWYQLGPGESAAERLERQLLAQRTAEAVAALAAGEPTDAALQALARHPVTLREGAAIFQESCTTCHGPSGEGGIGPNLTDDEWIHGSAPSRIYAVVRDGVFDQGCPAQSWSLREEEMFKVAAYVTTLSGLNLAGGSATTGSLFAATTRLPAQDPEAGAKLAVLVGDPTALAKGRTSFQLRCLPCHGPEGQGLIGPNLTDQYWVHGGGLGDIYRTVWNGIPEKGMIPWSTQLDNDEILSVSAYVFTLRGTNPPNPKAPEGQPWTSADEAAPAAAEVP